MGVNMSCSSARLWVTVVLLLMSVDVSRMDCCIPTLCQNTYDHTCCSYEQIVDSLTIANSQKVVNSSQFDWSVEANISWARPPGIDFDAYAVTLDYNNNGGLLSCNAALLDEYSVTDMEWIYLPNLPFGYQPTIIIYTVNKTAQVKNQRPNNYSTIELPDCYESTQDLPFCQSKDVLVPSKPIDLLVDDITTTSQAGSSTRVGLVNISWHPPAQLPYSNTVHTLGEFLVSLTRSDGNTLQGKIVLSTIERTYTNPFSLLFRHSFEVQGVPFNWTEEIQIKVQGCLYEQDQRCTGRAAFLDVQVNQFTEPIPPEVSLWVVATGVTGLFLVMLLLVICCCYLRHQPQPPPVEPKLDECFASKEFDRSLLGSLTKIGKGSSGIVYKGSAFGSLQGIAGNYTVAVKCVKVNATQDTHRCFLEEIKLMIKLGSHSNILTLLGCCTIKKPYLLLTEFMKYGDLLHFMWKSRESEAAKEDPIYRLTDLTNLQIARQIARGMEYISMIRYYHGDLAARNVLVGDYLQIKISDFGLASDIYAKGYERLKPDDKRPVKWVSLETNTTGRCTIESDVWSFGIVLYEIVTLGDVPYQGIAKLDIIAKLKQGYRMDQPEGCPLEIYDIMRQCWLEHPLSRPTFTKLTEMLDTLLAKDADYMELDESEKSVDGVNSEVKHGDADQSNEFSTLSGEPDELRLWLHVNGDLPESARTLDFVPMGAESTLSGDSFVMDNLQFERFPDSDFTVLTA